MELKILFVLVALNAQLAWASWFWNGSDTEQDDEYNHYDSRDNSDLAFLEGIGKVGTWLEGMGGFLSRQGKDFYEQQSSLKVTTDEAKPQELEERVDHFTKVDELAGCKDTEAAETYPSSRLLNDAESVDADDELSATTSTSTDHESECSDTEEELKRCASDKSWDSVTSASLDTIDDQSADSVSVSKQRKMPHFEPRALTDKETAEVIRSNLKSVANLQSELQKLHLPDALFTQIVFESINEAMPIFSMAKCCPLPSGLLSDFRDELIKGKSWRELEDLSQIGHARYVSIRENLAHTFPFTLGFFPHLVPESKALMQQLEVMLSLFVLFYPQLKSATALTKEDIAALTYLFIVVHKELDASLFCPLIRPFADFDLKRVVSFEDLKRHADAKKPYFTEACRQLPLLSKENL